VVPAHSYLTTTVLELNDISSFSSHRFVTLAIFADQYIHSMIDVSHRSSYHFPSQVSLLTATPIWS